MEVLRSPNAMLFGSGGGLINQVTKEPGFTPLHEHTLQGVSYETKRITHDPNEPVNDRVAYRFNAMYENSCSFRNYINHVRSRG